MMHLLIEFFVNGVNILLYIREHEIKEKLYTANIQYYNTLYLSSNKSDPWPLFLLVSAFHNHVRMGRKKGLHVLF